MKSRFYADHTKCQVEQKSIKSDSVCPICSGRSEVYFEGKDIRIRETTCRQILKACDEAWLNLILTLKVNAQYEEFKIYESKAFPTSKSQPKRLSIENKAGLVGKANFLAVNHMNNYAKRAQLEQFLLMCKGRFASCPFLVAANLCKNFVELVPIVKVLKIYN